MAFGFQLIFASDKGQQKATNYNKGKQKLKNMEGVTERIFLTTAEAVDLLRTTRPSFTKICKKHNIQPMNPLSPGKRASGTSLIWNRDELIAAAQNSKIKI